MQVRFALELDKSSISAGPFTYFRLYLCTSEQRRWPSAACPSRTD